MDTLTGPATFGAVFAGLYAAHTFADHWVQTQAQADAKGLPGWRGRLACLAHVTTYTLVAALALLALAWRTGIHLDHRHVAAGLLFSAITHYIADRRTPLRRAALSLKKSEAWLDKGGGLYALDQAWHVWCLFLAVLIIV